MSHSTQQLMEISLSRQLTELVPTTPKNNETPKPKAQK